MSRKQRIWWFASNIALVGLSATLAWALVFYPAAASFSDAVLLQDFIRPIGPSLWKPSGVFVYVGLPFVLLWGLRGRRQSADGDIQTIESLSWSWQGFLIPLLVLGLIPAVITFAIASSASEPGARLWDGRDGALVASLKGHTGAKVVDPSIEVIPTVYDASFSRDGRRLVTVGLDGTVRLWDGWDGTPIAVLEGPRILINSWFGSRIDSCILSASFSPDGTRIVTAGMGASVWLWDAQDGALIASQEALDTSVPIWSRFCTYSVRFSQDGTYIVTASGDDTTWLWDGQDGTHIGILEKDTRQVELASSSPEGTRIWTEDEDGAFRLRDRRQEDVPLAVLEGDTDRVVSAKLSPDETRILTISDDGTARLLGRWNGKPIAILEHELGVDSASFSPDGTRIVTTGPNTDDQRPLSVLWLVPGVLLGLAGGLRGAVRETKTSPNEGIRLSARNASVVALALGLTSVGLLIAFIAGRAMPDAYDLWAYYEGFESTTAVLVATVFGFVAVLSLLAYGGLDVLYHYLLRLILMANGHMPWQYARFLDYAAEHILLRKVGGGYIFIHRLLLDYFANDTEVGS